MQVIRPGVEGVDRRRFLKIGTALGTSAMLGGYNNKGGAEAIDPGSALAVSNIDTELEKQAYEIGKLAMQVQVGRLTKDEYKVKVAQLVNNDRYDLDTLKAGINKGITIPNIKEVSLAKYGLDRDRESGKISNTQYTAEIKKLKGGKDIDLEAEVLRYHQNSINFRLNSDPWYLRTKSLDDPKRRYLEDIKSRGVLDEGLKLGYLTSNRHKFLTARVGTRLIYNSFSPHDVELVAKDAEEVKQAVQDEIITADQAKYFDTDTYFHTTVTRNFNLSSIFKVLQEGLEDGTIDRKYVDEYIKSPDLFTASAIARSVTLGEISNRQASNLLAETHKYFGPTPREDFPYESRRFPQYRWHIDHQLPVIMTNMKASGTLSDEETKLADASRIPIILGEVEDTALDSYKKLRQLANIDHDYFY